MVDRRGFDKSEIICIFAQSDVFICVKIKARERGNVRLLSLFLQFLSHFCPKIKHTLSSLFGKWLVNA